MNIFNEIGALAISTRLQRLADQFRKEGELIYSENGITFEPKWFPIIYALYQKAPLSVGALSEEIGYAHPSTISLLKELEKRELVVSVKDEKDERKRLISLTPQSQELVQKMKPVWELMRKAAEDAMDTANNLLVALDEVEYQLQKESFFARYQRLSQEKQVSEVTIVDYKPEYRQAFYDLNYAWISDAYEVEPEDIKTLSDPETYYLAEGGAILIALYEGRVVGTCALKKSGAQEFEMSKMTVDRNLRGKKIGDLLGNACIEKARELGATRMILYSNKQGSSAAINLYRKLGFEEIPLTEKHFKRADIKMEMAIS